MYKIFAASALAAAASANVIENEWIVQLKSDVVGIQRYQHLESMGIEASDLIGEYNIGDFKGYAFRGGLNKKLMVEESDMVLSISPNEEVHAYACQSQSGATWGLTRTSGDVAPTTYVFDDRTTGTDVTAYIMDTGIRATHQDFGGRVADRCFTAFGAAQPCNMDGNGHGTHVAGTVGGTTYGVAKGVTLVDVKVLGSNGSGSFAGILNGIDWAVEDCRSNTNGKCVANMSLGGSGSTINAAVTSAANAGVLMVVASGNSNANACSFTPAGAGGDANTGVLSVNSMTSTNARSSFSNFGTCTDIFAPGSSVLSAWHTSDTATNNISGTSMASPHVAGAACVHWATAAASTPTAQLKREIISNASPNRISNPGTGSPNQLLLQECGQF